MENRHFLFTPKVNVSHPNKAFSKKFHDFCSTPVRLILSTKIRKAWIPDERQEKPQTIVPIGCTRSLNIFHHLGEIQSIFLMNLDAELMRRLDVCDGHRYRYVLWWRNWADVL